MPISWLKYKIKTLDDDGLRRAAQELAAKAAEFDPTLIIGIRSGGYVVAELMAASLPRATLLPVTFRRPSTAKKQKSSLLKQLLLKLPYALSNPLRIAEHIVLTGKPSPAQAFTPDAAESQAIAAWLAANPGARILVADDAVDSGATLAAVNDHLKQAAGDHAAIRTAAITVTTDSPLIQPDYSLYRYVLCRFPWSLDFKR